MTKVFTNGCFDILHPGHVDLLERAKKLGTTLIVGINSDDSVRAIKGSERPFLNEESRKAVLLALKSVDEVFVFDELTPESLIRQIAPDVLVKGGDWKVEEIIGADFVLKNGGKVFSLPLKGDFSSTAIVEKIKNASDKVNFIADQKVNDKKTPGGDTIENSLRQHVEIFENVLAEQSGLIEECARIIERTLRSGKKLLLCGNGGSAAAAQQIAAEFVGRGEIERRAFPAIALTTDTSALTTLANDYDFERIFARQIEALANEGDCLIALSAGGNLPNVIKAIMKARQKNCKIIGLTGAKGKKLASLCDACVLIPSGRTARIQEVHITVAHVWRELIDKNLVEKI